MVGAVEDHPFAGEAVDVGRVELRLRIVDLEVEWRLVIGDDEKDVRAAIGSDAGDGKYQTEEDGECFCHFFEH